MEIAQFLPAAVPAWAAILAVATAFLSAALTAAFGLGGGLALLAVMSAVFPASAVIPVHGVAQLGSNTGRFFLQLKDTVWPIVLWFSVGSVIGAMLGGRLAIEMPVWVLRGGVAFFILFTVWGPKPAGFSPGAVSFFSTGVVGSFLTMFFGATGPIAATMLSATKLDRLHTVATHAACMVFQHGMKILVFGVLGVRIRRLGLAHRRDPNLWLCRNLSWHAFPSAHAGSNIQAGFQNRTDRDFPLSAYRCNCRLRSALKQVER